MPELIDARITEIDKRFDAIETLNKKVECFSVELNKIWLYLHDMDKKNQVKSSMRSKKKPKMWILY